MSIDLPPSDSPATPVASTPAGWYPDPQLPTLLRYWDGTAWTQHVHSAVATGAGWPYGGAAHSPATATPAAAAPGVPAGVGRLLRALLVVQAMVFGAFTVTNLRLRGEADTFFDRPDVFTAAAVFDADETNSTVGRAALVLGVATLAVLIVWSFRMSRWAQSQGALLRYGSGWSVGAWFLPLANVVVPFMLLNDLFRCAEPGLSRPIGERFKGRPGAGELWAWWLPFMGGSLLLNVGTSRVDDIYSTPDDVMTGLTLRTLGAAGLAVSMLGLLLYVHATVGRVERATAGRM